MTFAAREESQFSGAPVEYFRFSQGATVWRFTSADIIDSIDDGGGDVEYTPAGLNRTAMDFSQEVDAANIEITMPETNPVAQLFVAYTPPTKVALVIRRKHRSDTDGEVTIWFMGSVVSVDFENGEAKLTCAPVSNAMKRLVPALATMALCNWVWGSTPCGMNIEDFREAGTVDAVTGAHLTAALFGTHVDGYYRAGWVERTTTGERRQIIGHTGTEVILTVPFRDLLVGEAFDAFPGCPHNETGCESFGDPPNGNILNQLAWPRIPTRNPYGGGSIA